MPQEVKRLSHVHMAIVEMALAGATRNEIASAMGRTPESVGLIIRSPLFQHELARRRDEQQKVIDGEASGTINHARKTLAEATQSAAEKLISVMKTTPDARLQKDAAVEILKRTYDPKYAAERGSNQLALTLQPGALLNLQIALRESSQLGAQVPSALSGSGTNAADHTQPELDQQPPVHQLEDFSGETQSDSHIPGEEFINDDSTVAEEQAA